MDKYLFGGANLALERAFEQRPMFTRGHLATKNDRDDQISQVFVEDDGMRVKQDLGAAGREQRVVKLEIVALPGVRCSAVPAQHAGLR
jgi:hypothetical protein